MWTAVFGLVAASALAPHGGVGVSTHRAPPRAGRSACCAATANVVLLVPAEAASPFGATSPEPSPAWSAVASHLAGRLSAFDGRISGSAHTDASSKMFAAAVAAADVVLAIDVPDSQAPALREALGASAASACVTVRCGPAVSAAEFVGDYAPAAEGALGGAARQLAPWAGAARGQRLRDQAHLLVSRWSSEDLIYALLFIVHAYVMPVPLVEHTVSPTWEKGPLRNAAEFVSMARCCGDEIKTAVSDPVTKGAIDQLNACDMRDQVGSYRVITSFETAELEAFSLCILQRNNCFRCDAAILETSVTPMAAWRGAPLDAEAASALLYGHLAIPEAHASGSALPWSWKIVCGANPAYDAFPAQHQLFYPGKATGSIWYDPVFKVETVDGREVWRRRHYRVRKERRADTPAGVWRFSTLDNGVLSDERWTVIDADDELSWCVFHYSGAAAVVGQSYVGALLCTADGEWPADADQGRVRAALGACGLELWELYGHGAAAGSSFMWSEAQLEWVEANPPPLTPMAPAEADAADTEAVLK